MKVSHLICGLAALIVLSTIFQALHSRELGASDAGFAHVGPGRLSQHTVAAAQRARAQKATRARTAAAAAAATAAREAVHTRAR